MAGDAEVPQILRTSSGNVRASSAKNVDEMGNPERTARNMFQPEDEDYSRVKALTLYKMVEDIRVDSNSQSHAHKLLFLTDAQANLLSETDGSMEKLVTAFEWRKPKLVIQFLRSIGGIGWFKSLPGDVLFSSDAVRGGILRDYPPWDSKLDAYQAEEKLITFMREVLIPLAADTNAVIIGCANHGDCTLSTAFGKALSLEMAKWGGTPPLTFIGTSSECVQFYLDEKEKLEDGRKPPFWRRIAEKSTSWMERDSKLKHIVIEKYPNLADSPYREANRLDLDPNVLNYIIVDTVNDRDLEIDTSKVAHNRLMTSLFRYLTEDVPSISIKTGMSENTGPISVDMANSALKAGSHVLFLDCRERPEFPVQGTAQSREEYILKRIEAAKQCYRAHCTKWYKMGLVEVFDIMTISYLWHAVYPADMSKKQRRTLFEQLELLREDGGQASGGAVKANDVGELVRFFAEILFSDMWRMHPHNKNSQPHPTKCGDGEGETAIPKDCGSEWVQSTGENMSQYKSIVTSLLLDPKFHALNVINLEQGRLKIREIIRSVRLPNAESRAGLDLLRHAWNEYDVAIHMSTRYKRITRGTYTMLMLLAFTSIVASAFNAPNPSLLGGTPEAPPAPASAAQWAVLASALLATLLSLQAFTNPAQRAVHFETWACVLQSLILQFRARVGPFTQSAKHTKPEHAFQRHLKAWRTHLAVGSDLQMAEYESVHPPHIFKHGQIAQADSRGWIEMFASTDAPRDDFFSPMTPEQYLACRVEPTLEYYRSHIVGSTRFRFVLQIMVVSCCAAAGACAATSQPWWLCALLAFVAASLWVQAAHYGAYLERSLGSLRELKLHQEWWESLDEDDQSAAETINHLVLRGEQIITSERLLGKCASVQLVD